MRIAGKVLTCAAVVTSSVAFAPGVPAAPPIEPTAEDGYFQAIEKVADGVWLIRQGQPFHVQPIGNVTVIEQEGGLVLVDAGGSPGAGRRIAALVKSVSAKPVAHIVVTHWHGDHTLGLSGVLESWPQARILTSAETRSALLGSSMERYAKGAPDADSTAAFLKDLEGVGPFLKSSLEKPGLAPEERAGFERTQRELAIYQRDVVGLYLPANILAHGGKLTLPDPFAPVELIHPGRANTDGDTAVWLPKQKILISGDILVAPVPFGFGSYPAQWVESLTVLRSYPFVSLIPGHGEVQRDKSYIDRLVALIEDVRRQVRPLAEKGLSLEDTRKQVDFSEHKRQFTAGDPWLARWFDQYWTRPFVEAAWKEAKGIPIEQGKG